MESASVFCDGPHNMYNAHNFNLLKYWFHECINNTSALYKIAYHNGVWATFGLVLLLFLPFRFSLNVAVIIYRGNCREESNILFYWRHDCTSSDCKSIFTVAIFWLHYISSLFISDSEPLIIYKRRKNQYEIFLVEWVLSLIFDWRIIGQNSESRLKMVLVLVHNTLFDYKILNLFLPN